MWAGGAGVALGGGWLAGTWINEYAGLYIQNGLDAVFGAPGSGSTTAPSGAEGSSNGSRREAMRQQGIPTSQQPESQSEDDAGRTYQYRVPAPRGGTQVMSVQQQTKDRSHPGQEHWEAGKVKTDSTGNARTNSYGRPKLQNDKSKVDVERK
jgi:hypothetical protein